MSDYESEVPHCSKCGTYKCVDEASGLCECCGGGEPDGDTGDMARGLASGVEESRAPVVSSAPIGESRECHCDACKSWAWTHPDEQESGLSSNADRPIELIEDEECYL